MSTPDQRARESPVASGQALKRSLTVFDLLVYGLMLISPTAPFAGFGIVFNASKGMVPLVYVIGLVAMFFTALSYVVMSKEFPSAGSVYAYATGCFGSTVGFFAGWSMILDYLLVPALIYITAAVAVGSVLPQVPIAVWAAILMAGNTLVNLLGIESVAKANITFFVLQLAALVVFLLVGTLAVVKGVSGAHLSLAPLFRTDQVSLGLVSGAVAIGVLNYLGFDAISTLAEEAKDGAASVGRATLLAVMITAILFIAQSYVASLFVLGRLQFPPGMPTYAAFYDIATTIGGWWLKCITSIVGIFLSSVAAALVAQATIARLLFSMARDGRLPAALAHVNPKSRVPDRAVVAVAVITIGLILLFSQRLTLLVSIVSFGALVGFLFLHASVVVHFMLRRRSNAWIRHAVCPILGFGIIAYVIWQMSPHAKIVGGCWFAVGVAVAVFSREHSHVAGEGVTKTGH
jgi:amino acid transporter